ncbi:altered inheritance rate of mitochondria protein 25 [Panicum miliaceum]|uniref:Altered inheritance rate of mitochondria protein 25 n=1 Tax=Panicum miliaceum TaxID=4540 RepID=A0A3L6QCG7_PANMI|nr:altered inheritance rate of mitochondria protein 25 [Panicum miliaceum]
MRWLPRLLSHAAAAGRASAAARSTSSHVRGGSNGFASGGWDGSPAVPREWLRKLWREELRKQKEAARALGAFPRSYQSVEAAGAAREAPSYQYDDRDLDPVEASGFWKL